MDRGVELVRRLGFRFPALPCQEGCQLVLLHSNHIVAGGSSKTAFRRPWQGGCECSETIGSKQVVRYLHYFCFAVTGSARRLRIKD